MIPTPTMSRAKGSVRISRAGDAVSRARTFFVEACNQISRKDRFGATPNPTRETRALPGNLATLNAMARLHEYQGKAILAANGFNVPRGRAASTGGEAVAAVKERG